MKPYRQGFYNYLWVVEILEDGWWRPTVGAYLSRQDARREKAIDWEENMPHDKFRIKKYCAIRNLAR
jgi:hypothetical protein